jgi:DNA-binding phage protein
MARRKLKLYPWDTTDYLKSEQDIAEYLEAVREENEPGLSEAALRDIERARIRWKIKPEDSTTQHLS